MILKKIPEDFIVRELYKPVFDPSGEYSYYLLEKKDMNTVEACGRIAEKMHISPKFINFAGTKDRRAVTFQHISIRRGHNTGFLMSGLKLTYLGKGKDRINLGTHEGNDFRITIRDIDTLPKRIERFLNLFDEQRFGMRGNNHQIGKAMMKGDFRLATDMLDESVVREWLQAHQNDYVGAMKRLQKKILQIYVHSYQSFLWNRAAVLYNARHPGDFIAELKVPGFGEVEGTKGDDITDEILREESIGPRDFIIRQLPELSCEAGKRKLFAEIMDLAIGDLLPDELSDKMKVTVSFRLGNGSYATLAVKSMF